MSVWSHKNSRLFVEIALQRYEDAEILLKAGRTTAAVYLAGYAAECVLKAALLANTPPRKHDSLRGQFRGNKGHSLEWLRFELTKRGLSFPAEVMKHFQRVTTWSTDLRYSPGRFPTADAKSLLGSTDAIMKWIDSNWGS